MNKIVFFGLWFTVLLFSDSNHRVDFNIANMDCVNCLNRVQTDLLNQPQITSVNIVLSSKNVTVYSREKLSFKSFTQPLMDLGYKVRLIQKKDTIVITANGIVCSFCIIGIQKQFQELSSVQSAKFLMETGELLITLKDNDISNKKIRTIYEDAGYEVKSIVRKKI